MTTDIISSWEKNAAEWIKVIQENSIASRQITNKAIVDTVLQLDCKKMVDIGCGEGWLTRKLGEKGIQAVGIDAIEALIQEARARGKETYQVFSFENIISGEPIPGGPYDCAVFNFCLYLKEGLEPLLRHTLRQIKPKGSIVIQTLHPYFLIQNGLAYQSQWLSDSWKGLPGNFEKGHSWYARTFEDWHKELFKLGNTGFTIKEILNDEQKPVSLILKIQKLK